MEAFLVGIFFYLFFFLIFFQNTFFRRKNGLKFLSKKICIIFYFFFRFFSHFFITFNTNFCKDFYFNMNIFLFFSRREARHSGSEARQRFWVILHFFCYFFYPHLPSHFGFMVILWYNFWKFILARNAVRTSFLVQNVNA